MGKILVEFRDHYGWFPALTPYAANVERTWVHNDIGTASFTLPLTTPYLYSITKWGRIFRILEDGLPPWVGVAEEREWSESGVTLSLKSAEWLLNKKVTRQGLAFTAGTAVGTIAHGLFTSGYLGSSIVRPIQAGIFDASTPRFVEPYNYADAWEEMKKLADEGGCAVWVDSDLKVHFRASRGTDKSASIKLREGTHLVGVKIKETIADALTGAVTIGKEVNGVRQKLATSYNGDLGYERLQALSFDNTADYDGLLALTKQEIADRVFPKLTVDAEFVKATGSAFWGQFFIGDTVELLLSSYPNYNAYTGQMEPFAQKARVLGIEIGGEDQMRLVLETRNPFADPNRLPFIGWTPS